jgi:hypothetical protein
MLAAVTFVIGLIVSVWLGLKGEDANNGSAIFLDIGLELAPFGLIAAAAVWLGTTRIAFGGLALAAALVAFLGVYLAASAPFSFSSAVVVILAIGLQYVIAVVAVLIAIVAWLVARWLGRAARSAKSEATKRGG